METQQNQRWAPVRPHTNGCLCADRCCPAGAIGCLARWRRRSSRCAPPGFRLKTRFFSISFSGQESLWWHRAAWFVGWVFLTLVYFFFLGLTDCAPVATVCTSIFLCVPAVICYYKLQLRGEPFLPWDFAQASEAFDVAGKVYLWVTKSMCGAAVVLLLLTLISCFLPRLRFGWVRWIVRSVVPLGRHRDGVRRVLAAARHTGYPVHLARCLDAGPLLSKL